VVTDDDGGTDSAATTVTVGNIDPVVTVSGDSILENGTATITVNVSDIGMQDSHTVDIDWGQGEVSDLNQSVVVGANTFTHQYLDDNPTGTPFDVYSISVIATDDDGGTGTGTTTVTVTNIAPTLDGHANVIVNIFDPMPIDPTGFDDIGTQDTHVAFVDWGDGSTSTITVVEPAGIVRGVITGSHTFTEPGTVTVTITLTDDDGTTDVETFLVEVRGSRSLLQRAADNLSHHLDDSKHIGHAIKHLDKALEDENWIDEIHAEHKKGQKIFHESASAVHELEKVLKEDADGKHPLSPEARAWVESALSDIEIATVLLAEIRLDESDGLIALDPGKQDKVDRENEKAADHFVKAGDHIATGNLDKGIREYAKAWHHAVHAELEAVKLPS